MNDQKQKLSVARLIDREKYYKEKALQLEKDIIFAHEQIAALETELNTLVQEKESDSQAKEIEEQKRKEIEQRYETLSERHKKETENYQKLVADLEKERESIKKNQRSENDIDRGVYDQRMKSYERLLAEVQSEINDKNKELDLYKRRLSVMEKRLKSQGDMTPTEHPTFDEDNKASPIEQKAIPYLDYAVILSDTHCILRGDLIIENLGQKHLGTPYVCFRFTPGDAAQIKGRILTWDSADRESLEQENWQWVFLDTDWALEAKERGELWMHPTTSVKIPTGESIFLSDWQVPIEKKFYNQITIEVFIYFQESDYRVKAVNQILINL